MICIGAPNFVHRDIAVAAAEAGKHIVCEKPLARTMAEADEMIAATRRAGVKLMYAELICFAPRYVRAKELMDEGAFGRVFQIRHGETHYGPHSDWFWDGRSRRRRRDDGHGLPQRRDHPLAVRQARRRERHRRRWARSCTGSAPTWRTTRSSRSASQGDRLGVVEGSWAKPGGMDDRLDIQGSAGTCHGDMMQQSSLFAYSDVGYGYSVEKGSTLGYSYAIAEEYYNYGMPQEMQHFTDCVLDDRSRWRPARTDGSRSR